jgi:hypothetical protein
MFPMQQILLCFLSNEDVATTMREVSQSLTLAQVSRRIRRETVSQRIAKEKSRQSAASLRGERTSTDRPDTRHQGVRIDCKE